MDSYFTFQTISVTICKLFLLISVGFLAYKAKLVGRSFADGLSNLLVTIFFPALIIYKTTAHFSFTEYAAWWLLPLLAIALSLSSLVLSVLALPFLSDYGSKREFLCANAFQNSGYLPMNLILFSFADETRDKFLIYTFLFLIGFNVLIWSFAPVFLSKDGFKKLFDPRTYLNMPMVAAVLSIIWVAFFGSGSIPRVVMDPLKQVGEAAFPIAMVTLGMYLAMYTAHLPEKKRAVLIGMVLKLIVFPFLVLSALPFIPLGGELKFYVFLQSVMPSAVTLVMIGSYTGSDSRFFSSIVFYTHLAAILTIPFWFWVYGSVL